MARSIPILLCLLAACAAAGGSSVLATRPLGVQLRTELSSKVLGTSERDGRRVISLDLRNDTDRALHFAWAVEWMDRTGTVREVTPEGWRKVRLESGEATPIEIEAPNPRAASWRLIAIDVST